MTRPLVLVTGASSGIGADLARVIAADDCDLILTARRRDRLDALASEIGNATVVTADLSDPAAGDVLQGAIAALGRPIDVLVNNAGFGHAAPAATADPAEQLGMVDVNVRAAVDLTRRMLPGMLARGTGGVLNVASTAAYLPGPNVAVYYASKAFLLSFSEARWEEARHAGVTVTALCPGPTTSEFGAVSGMERLRLFRSVKRMSSRRVAEIGWRGFKAGRRVVVPGVQNKIGAVITRAAPRRLLLPLVAYLQS